MISCFHLAHARPTHQSDDAIERLLTDDSSVTTSDRQHHTSQTNSQHHHLSPTLKRLLQELSHPCHNADNIHHRRLVRKKRLTRGVKLEHVRRVLFGSQEHKVTSSSRVTEESGPVSSTQRTPDGRYPTKIGTRTPTGSHPGKKANRIPDEEYNVESVNRVPLGKHQLQAESHHSHS
jgi:hypothetical protein